MHLLVVTMGSRGDVQPYVALGVALQAAGFTVTLATHSIFEDLVTSHHMRFAPITGNPQELLASDAGQDWLRSAGNPVRFLRGLRSIALPFLDALFADLMRVSEGVEGIVCSALAISALHVAEKRGIPVIVSCLIPATPTRAFATPLLERRNLGALGNWLSHVFIEQVAAFIGGTAANAWRRQHGMMPAPHRGLTRMLHDKRIPMLLAYSPLVVAKPADWSAHEHVTGYWFLHDADAWIAPHALSQFLAAGPPPVYVGFGSMVDREAVQTARTVVAALSRAGQRGVLLTGWGGLQPAALPPTILQIPSAPHDWLFPRMAAVVHHGGAGTTAAALRAGVPQVIAPFFGDQPFWARRVWELGLGPQPLAHESMNVDSLSEAISAAVDTPAYSAAAAAMGAQVRAEDGVAAAVAIIKTACGMS